MDAHILLENRSSSASSTAPRPGVYSPRRSWEAGTRPSELGVEGVDPCMRSGPTCSGFHAVCTCRDCKAGAGWEWNGAKGNGLVGMCGFGKGVEAVHARRLSVCVKSSVQVCLGTGTLALYRRFGVAAVCRHPAGGTRAQGGRNKRLAALPAVWVPSSRVMRRGGDRALGDSSTEEIPDWDLNLIWFVLRILTQIATRFCLSW